MSHLATIGAMPCVLCELLGQRQASKTDAHHIRTGQGKSQRAPDVLAIPLCHKGCHQGPHGIHGDRALFKQAKVTELDLLGIVFSRLLSAPAPAERRITRKAAPAHRKYSDSTARPSKCLPRPNQ